MKEKPWSPPMAEVRGLTELTLRELWWEVKDEDEWWGDLKQETLRVVQRLLEEAMEGEMLANRPHVRSTGDCHLLEADCLAEVLELEKQTEACFWETTCGTTDTVPYPAPGQRESPLGQHAHPG